MAEPKGTRKKRTEEAAESETTATNTSGSESTETEKSYIQATGLEDYGRWKSMFKDYKRDENEKPFRRGRIWS